MSTGYIPKILTHRATAAAYKCDLALIIVCMNDVTMSARPLVDDIVAAGVVVVDALVAEEIFAAAPPRGNIVAEEMAIVEVVTKDRFIGKYGGHIFVA